MPRRSPRLDLALRPRAPMPPLPASRPRHAITLALPRAAFRAATAVSYVVNPLVLPAILFGITLLHLGATGAEASQAAGVALIFFCLLPITYVGLLIRRGEVESLEVRDRSKRTGPFLVGTASALLSLPVLYVMDLPGTALLLAMGGGMVANSLVMLAITLRWKISVHMAGLSGFLAMLWVVAAAFPSAEPLVTRGGVLMCAVLVPLLMWARVRSRAHTWGQVVAGAGFGAGASLAELYALNALGVI